MIFRKTEGLCPFCLKTVEGAIIEQKGCVFFQKSCPSHGLSRVLLSRSPLYYKELDEFYFAVMDEDKALFETELYVTFRCNMKCPLCYLDIKEEERRAHDPTLSDIEEYLKKSEQKFFILTGGEPTCREDLPEIIRLLKRYSRSVSINTNGLRLADINYLKSLKEAGLDRVNLQMDTFCPETDREFRGEDYLVIKTKTLENLCILNMPTGINCVVVKGINEDRCGEMVEFVARNHFVKAINFLTLAIIGSARDYKLDDYIMPDELVDLLAKQTEGKVSRGDIFRFQKLHLAMKSFFSQRFCFYSQSYVAVRTGKGYEPISNFLNLKNTEPWLAKYQNTYKKSKARAGVFLLVAIAAMFSSFRSLQILRDILLMSVSYFFKTSHYLKSSRFFYINFTTGCDRYKKDLSITKNCHSEVTCFDLASGAIRHVGKASHFYLDREMFLTGREP